jgi:tetratricopeptide (TPR) repeat protein
MHARSSAWQEALNQRRYRQAVAEISAMVREATTPEELLVAARAAGVAMLPGLGRRLLRSATRNPACPPAGPLALAALYISGGRYLQAEELLAPRVVDPAWPSEDRAGAQILLAVSLAGRRRFNSATEALDRASSAYAASASGGAKAEADVALDLSYARLSVAYFADRWEEAEAGLAAHVAAGVNQSRFYLLLALCRESLGRPAEALQTLQEGCDRLPEHPGLWLTASGAAWSLDQTDLALQCLDRFADLLPYAAARRLADRARQWYGAVGVRLPVPAVRQAHNHCFPACLSMVMAYWGRPTDHRQLGRAVMESRRGTSLFSALHHLEAEGWTCRTFRATPDRLKALVDAGVPAIIGLEYAGGAHVHVCVGYDSTSLWLQDPVSPRRRRLRLSQFAAAYAHSDYWALAFAPAGAIVAALGALPPEDDHQIRLMQRCLEALDHGEIEPAREAFAGLAAEPSTAGLKLFRLRLWPRLGERGEALAAAEELLAAFPAHREIRLEVARHLERLNLADRAVALAEENPGRRSSAALLILGRAAAAGDQPDQASALFREAAIADPHQAEAVAAWGRSEAQAGRLEQAEALFLAAAEMEPSPAVTAHLAELYEQMGRPDRATALLQASPDLADSPSLLERLCRLQLGARAWPEVLRTAEEAMVRFPGAVRFPPMAAEALRNLGRAAEGLALLATQEERCPDSAYALARFGRFLLLEGEAAGGITRIEQALALDPEWAEPVDWVCGAIAHMADPGPAVAFLEGQARHRPALCWTLARHWSRRDPAQAMGWAETALIADGRTPAAMAEFGHVALAAGQPEEAKRAFEGALEQGALAQGAGARTCYGLALLAQRAKQAAEAIRWFREAVAAARNPEETRYFADQLADLLEAQKDWAAIRTLLADLADRVPEPWRLTYLGYVAEQEERQEEALDLFAAALQLDPALIWAHYRRPQALLAAGRKAEALQFAQDAASRWPGENGLIWVLGRCQEAMGDEAEATGSYLRAAALNPDWNTARYSLWSLLAKSDWEAVVDRLSPLAPDLQARLLDYFGIAWSEAGNLLRARQAWDCATVLAPSFADAYTNLAQSHLNEQNPVLAWECTVPFLAHNPSEAVPFARWLFGRTPPEAAAAALERALALMDDHHPADRAEVCWLLGEARHKLDQSDQAVAAWERALADQPHHRGAIGRLSAHYLFYRRDDPLLGLLTPLDEAGELPADIPSLVRGYLRAAIRQNRPRRPHWRQLIVDRIGQIAREGKADPGEVDELQELYERLEVEFGNLRAAWYASILKDELLNWAPVLWLALVNRLRRPPLDLRPGESAGPAVNRPLLPWEPWPRGPWLWVTRNPFTVVLFAVLLFLAFAGSVQHPYQPSPEVVARAPKEDPSSPLRIAGPLIAMMTLAGSRWAMRRR